MNSPHSRLYAPEAIGGAAGAVVASPAPSAPTSGPSGSLLAGAPTPASTPAPAGGGSAVADPFWNGYFRTDGTLDRSRLDKLPDELKDARPFLERLKSPDDLFKSYVHAQKLVREKGLTPLREGASEAEIAEHRATLAKINGVPEKPEGYGIKRPDDVPESVWDQSYTDAMSKLLHKHALPPAAVQELVAEHTKLQMAALEKAEQSAALEESKLIEQEQAKLKGEFGLLYDRKIQDAVRGAKWLGIDIHDPIFKNASMVIAAAKVADRIKEASHVDGQGAGAEGAPSPAAEITAMTSDPKHKFYNALRDPNNPLHTYAIEHRRKLARQMDAEAAVVGRR